jgi:hypothetical protein
MKKEDILLWVSTVGAVLFALVIILDRNDVAFDWYDSVYFQFFLGLIFIFIPMAILLWVSKMKNITYTRFFKFSRVYLLIYLFIYLISSEQGEWFVPSRGDMAMFMTLVYFILGIVYLFFLFMKHKKAS